MEIMEIMMTDRGFHKAVFNDLYGEFCSIQKSSLATDDAIWIGIENPKLTVFKDHQKGKYMIVDMPSNFSVAARMHLNRDQVKRLLPLLKRFAKTGELL